VSVVAKNVVYADPKHFDKLQPESGFQLCHSKYLSFFTELSLQQ